MKTKEKIIIGLTEKVLLFGADNLQKEVIAKIDTGASKSSIDKRLAVQLKIGPIIETRFIRSASGSGIRPVVKVKCNIKGQTLNSKFTLADRKNMNYKVLIGQNMLKKGFLIDPSKE